MESISNPLSAISMLLVEDEKVPLELLTIALTKKFPHVTLHSAINGREGLEFFKEYMPDIVITDINMPEMGGVQMVNKIRAIKADTKFIVLTGDTGKLILHDSVGKGLEIDHYIMKPVMLGSLFLAIEQCVAEIVQHQS